MIGENASLISASIEANSTEHEIRRTQTTASENEYGLLNKSEITFNKKLTYKRNTGERSILSSEKQRTLEEITIRTLDPLEINDRVFIGNKIFRIKQATRNRTHYRYNAVITK